MKKPLAQIFFWIFVIFVFGLASRTQIHAQVKKIAYIPKPGDYKYTFGQHKPVMRIKPGWVVETTTEDCYDGRVKSPQDIPTQVIPPDHDNPQTGPFFVEGAEPGDTLAVHLLKLEPARDYGISSYFPYFGALSVTDYTALLHPPLPEKVWWYEINNQNKTVRFKALNGHFSCEIPMRPFLGCLGVAPARNEARWTVVPEAFGGNLDFPEVKEGNTIYLPVNVKGALLFMGDGHLVQGDGEIIGTAVEAAMKVTFVVEVIKNWKISWPRVESDEFIMSVGSYRPLEDAFRIAHKDMVTWLINDFGLEMMDAYQLLSQVGQAKIAQVVDPNYTVAACFPKKYLPDINKLKTPHNKLKSIVIK
ncbi:MAG: acetamidase/formamidase family protein [Candidatus Aminicenantes bacterium]|nr:acetamidase/formamidase family protein [Candidatus Aminicenantes bacterium]